jgi:hypothetical protein
LRLPADLAAFLAEQLAVNRFEVLPILLPHALAVRDPTLTTAIRRPHARGAGRRAPCWQRRSPLRCVRRRALVVNGKSRVRTRRIIGRMLRHWANHGSNARPVESYAAYPAMGMATAYHRNRPFLSLAAAEDINAVTRRQAGWCEMARTVSLCS